MTIRLDAREDAMLARLAERWGVSKNEAVVRAVAAADRESARDQDIAQVSAEMMKRWGPALDRLGSV
jgi:hypothetical protein